MLFKEIRAVKRELKKIEKYSRLISIAKKQHRENKWISLPKFTPFIISDCGELSPMAYDLLEWLVEQFRKKCAKTSPRADGCLSADLVRGFRHKIKVNLHWLWRAMDTFL